MSLYYKNELQRKHTTALTYLSLNVIYMKQVKQSELIVLIRVCPTWADPIPVKITTQSVSDKILIINK